MIIFDIQCACGCLFEGWFDSRDDFEQQSEDKLISCPECGGLSVDKVLSPVAIRSKKSPQALPSGGNEYSEKQAVHFLRFVQEYVEKNFEDVGAKFAEQSLKMHYGVNEPKNIRGVTTSAEEKMLQDEGVELMKVPVVNKPDDSDLN